MAPASIHHTRIRSPKRTGGTPSSPRRTPQRKAGESPRLPPMRQTPPDAQGAAAVSASHQVGGLRRRADELTLRSHTESRRRYDGTGTTPERLRKSTKTVQSGSNFRALVTPPRIISGGGITDARITDVRNSDRISGGGGGGGLSEAAALQKRLSSVLEPKVIAVPASGSSSTVVSRVQTDDSAPAERIRGRGNGGAQSYTAASAMIAASGSRQQQSSSVRRSTERTTSDSPKKVSPQRTPYRVVPLTAARAAVVTPESRFTHLRASERPAQSACGGELIVPPEGGGRGGGG